MDHRRRPKRDSAASPQSLLSTPSHLLRDVSNLKTPRPYSQNPNPNHANPSPLFFTASKTPFPSSTTPISSKWHSTFHHRASTSAVPASRSKAARKLKALELEQSRSARKAHVRREKKFGSFARSLSAWISFLLQNPKACGCNARTSVADDQSSGLTSNGKRGNWVGETIDICGKWRSPKRQRGETNMEIDLNISSMKPTLSLLEKSLSDVCSLEDMRERMMRHMSRKCCNDVLLIMSRICKNIDEGRLNMKLHCPLVTDLAVKEKAIKILMYYSPMWLRIGLYILFGGDSLLLKHEQHDNHFLEGFIERHLLTHVGIAKKFALNKLVGGLYRPGYYETLGNVILKRFFLLVIALDKAKCESSLPIELGIDGIDGGSPLLFTHTSPIKSSRQVIQEFLMDSMHGEGDLLAHLVLLGCKVNYQQSPLCEYDFNVKNIFEDFQDGILLCRVVQLLMGNETVLSKIRSPSDTPKKSLQNCSIALQYLKDYGVQMSDSDGIKITATDLSNGDKELTCSILWNVFVHLQVPLLVNRTLLLKEIAKIKGSDVEFLECNALGEMDLLLQWIQAVCATQNVKICSISSLVDGRALTCLIKYYFGNDIHRSSLQKENDDECSNDRIGGFNFHSPRLLDMAYVQNVIATLGNSPKFLHPCDIFDEDACIDERSIMILLAFYASKLISLDKPVIMDTSEFSQQSYESPVPKPSSISGLQDSSSINLRTCRNKDQYLLSLHNTEELERSAIFIQARMRGLVKRNYFLRIKRSVILLQSAVRAWLALRFGNGSECNKVACSTQCSMGIYERYLKLMIERQRFIRTKRAVILIQAFVRDWIRGKYDDAKVTNLELSGKIPRTNAVRQPANIEGSKTLDLQRMAATKIQEAWKGYFHNTQLKRSHSAIKIQSLWRCWSVRKDFLCKVEAIKIIQLAFRRSIYQMIFYRKRIAAIEMQRFIRGHLVRTKLLGASKKRPSMVQKSSYDAINDSFMNNCEVRIIVYSIIKLQRWWKQILLHKSMRQAAIISIQSFVRGCIISADAAKRKQSIYIIQRAWRNILLNRMKKSSIVVIQACIRGRFARRTAAHNKQCIIKIQSWWRKILHLKIRKTSVLIIQAHVRGWIARRKSAKSKHDVVIIQSHWKGYLARKCSKAQLQNLRQRMKLSALNVSDEMRLINRLVVALSELLGYKSMSNIRQTCATLDRATELSKKCCETLVNAGAIDILLKQIQLLNRGIPDQEVLKHVLSTLRNIVRYEHLSYILINTPRSMEIIFQEMLRNKNEGFLISCQLLRKLCTIQAGLKAARKLQAHVKRLHSVIVKLERKAKFLGRNARQNNKKDLTARRLGEAIALFSLIVDRD